MGGQLFTLTEDRGNTTHFDYDYRGNVTEVIDAEGNVTEYEYDSYGNRTLERRKDVTQPDGSKKDVISYWHYDSEGRILFYTDPERIDPNDVANPDNATTRHQQIIHYIHNHCTFLWNYHTSLKKGFF